MGSDLAALGTAPDGSTSAGAQAVNASGAAAGYSRKYAGSVLVGSFAVRWDSAGAVTELGNLGVASSPDMFSNAMDINDNGAVVGYATKFVGGVNKGARAVRWDAGSTVATELGTLGTDSSGFASISNKAMAINNAGVAVGLAIKYVNGVDTGGRAVRWASGATTPVELGNLGINPSGFTSNAAVEINDAGTIIGNVEKYAGGAFKGSRAVRWSGGGVTVTELGNLGTTSAGLTTSGVTGINASGLIVGYAQRFDAGVFVDERAVVWGANGAAIDLTTLIDPASGWISLRNAYAIDDNNWVTGDGRFDPDGSGPLPEYHRYFIMQVPEPGSLSLALLSLLGLAFDRRSRRRRR